MVCVFKADLHQNGCLRVWQSLHEGMPLFLRLFVKARRLKCFLQAFRFQHADYLSKNLEKGHQTLELGNLKRGGDHDWERTGL
jgi:hypothetical protein